MSPAPASFELERFSVIPLTDDTVLLELQGKLVDVPPRSAPPRLLVEGTRRSRHERDALEVELDADRLRASFVVPAADAETAGFALAVGGVLLELPGPDPAPGADRTVALARELNGARRQLTRQRAQLEEQAEGARGHADELTRVREEAGERAQETVQAAEERAAASEQAAGERVAEMTARMAESEQAASARESELETACSQLEGVLADVRASAEQRDATAAEDRRQLEARLTAAEAETKVARFDADRASARVAELEREAARTRSDLELAQRALEARDAELARSPDRRARAVGRPRTVAALPDEEPAGGGGPTVPEAADEPADVPGLATADASSAVGEAAAFGPEADGQATAPFAADDVAGVGDADEGDPAPDDGEPDATVTHDAVPVSRLDAEPPEDTGPIPLRRGSERRYVPRSDRDEEIGGDAVRVLGRDRPRASSLPPPPEAEPGPPALPFGLTPRTLVIAVLAIAAFLVLVAILGYVF